MPTRKLTPCARSRRHSVKNMAHLDIHLAYAGKPVQALTSDDGTAICTHCKHLRPGGQPDYHGICSVARVWIYEDYAECDHHEEAERGQRTLL